MKNSKCLSRGDTNETINHTINEFCKLVQKEYKSRQDWVGEAIHK